MVTTSFIARSAAVLGFLSVALGAFGAHALESRLSTEQLEIYHTGVHYQFLHAIALLALSVWTANRNNRWITSAAISFLVGVILFSGSLYLLVATGTRGWGAITPLGGVAFLIGWALVGIAATRDNLENHA